MRILFVRHGETEWNASLRYQGHADIPLNDRGLAQARAAARRLATYNVAAIYTSDLARAAGTAAQIGEVLGLAPRPMPDLREIHVGQWEGLTPEELYRRYPDHMREYDRDPARTVRLGGESYAQLQERALRALTAIAEANPAADTVVAVSHGGTIRALLCHVIGLDLKYFGRMWLDNGSFTELRQASSGWRLLRLNDAAHLEGTTLASGE
ncbi:MAG TPA: histidine phosphatase family protein [Roseiflexaceae bacterium]|nr:histidine phosphatase family protein [Roseiflexaceae bacterium]